MVEIQLDSKYWLRSDERQWKISECSIAVDNEGKEFTRWKPKLFLSSLETALQAYYDLSLKQSKAKDWEKLIRDSKTIKKRIKKVLQRVETSLENCSTENGGEPINSKAIKNERKLV